ncbi:hypothetical protein DFJ74DRAFT_666277 [Hyaloraphidium curvatum]|nr:hypothetical protein DFJ74DRAFT_666277 [Hyaloraphidium curvatum]
MVLGFGQSQCVIPFLRGFFLGNATAAAEYDTCLAAENAASIDWELAALATVAGSSPWQGMPAAPISTRSATTASATVSPTPTSRPSSADAPSEEAWMALAAIAAGAVAML